MRFDKELLRNERRTVGRLDGRFTGHRRRCRGRHGRNTTRASRRLSGPYTATFNDYVRSDLKFDSDLPYEFLTGRVRPWNYAAV